jgi:hypothetical protein
MSMDFMVIYGDLMGFNGISWDLMGFNGIWIRLMVNLWWFNGISWDFMIVNGLVLLGQLTPVFKAPDRENPWFPVLPIHWGW